VSKLVSAQLTLRQYSERTGQVPPNKDLAGRVLRYLFRAEHQPELAFAA